MFSKVRFAAMALCLAAVWGAANEKATFWQEQTKGTNYFNKVPTEIWFKAASDLGIQWARLAYAKWASEERDFLMGDADDYQGLVEADLQKLLQALDWAEKHRIKIVIAPLGLPGNRWFQNNGRKRDLRLWNDSAYWNQAAQFWQDLAKHLNNHPAIVAYNLINEPTPEMRTGLPEQSTVEAYKDWYQKYRGTTHDLPAFYEKVIAEIRKVDSQTPIMLDSGWYARPAAFSYWPKMKDENLLFAFHMYEPYAFTSGGNFRGKKNYTYPGVIPYAETKIKWDKAQLERYFAPYFQWAASQGISKERLVVGEFGCFRRNEGCVPYLADVLEIFNQQQLHWAFYAFREDAWDGMNYELGTGKPSDAYWHAHEKGRTASFQYQPNPLFEVISREFQPAKP